MHLYHWRFIWLFLLCLMACGGEQTTAPAVSTPPLSNNPPAQDPLLVTNIQVPDNRKRNPLQILLFGNSHSGSHNLPGTLQILLQQGTGNTVGALRAGGAAYLDERLDDQVSRPLLESGSWTHLILQAQKYSTTGLYNYSTAGAKSWIALAKAKGITPVLFPEHPRAGNTEEGMRIFQLHQQIAAEQSACVAPVGPVWDQVRQQWPDLPLHSDDGNHAAPAGALLTAYILYQVISGQPAEALPDLPALQVPLSTQRILRQAASAGLRQYPACPF
jgi:hypothetical protein